MFYISIEGCCFLICLLKIIYVYFYRRNAKTKKSSCKLQREINISYQVGLSIPIVLVLGSICLLSCTLWFIFICPSMTHFSSKAEAKIKFQLCIFSIWMLLGIFKHITHIGGKLLLNPQCPLQCTYELLPSMLAPSKQWESKKCNHHNSTIYSNGLSFALKPTHFPRRSTRSLAITDISATKNKYSHRLQICKSKQQTNKQHTVNFALQLKSSSCSILEVPAFCLC